MKNHPFQITVKRAVDAVFSAMILLMGLPLFGLVALLVRWKMGRPVFFRQRRPGLHGRPFILYKFRTMNDARHGDGSLKPDGERLTWLGRFLRGASLDELPQLWNVLRGEMSLIGPRPDFIDHAREYLVQIPEYRARHSVRPGISGLAQVTLGYAAGLDETRAKANADLAYIRNASVALEARVFWLTLVTVLMRRGA